MENPDPPDGARASTRTSALALAAAMLGAACAPAFAQEAAAPPPGVAACASIEIDAARLACYDAAAGRVVPSTREADAAAEAAQATAEAAEAAAKAARDAQEAALPHPTPSERAQAALRRGGASLFRRDAPAIAATAGPIAPETQAAIANAGKGSLLDTRWELARDSKLGIFNFRAYKPVYLFPAFWSSSPNAHPFSPSRGTATDTDSLDALEAKFQISFKTKAVENLFGDNGDLWMAYTQSSRWQVYNSEASRPFRETDYEPEVMLAFRTGYGLLGWKGRLFAVGIDHQSNGRSDPLWRCFYRVLLIL
jgi:phospholipase A1